MSVLHFLAQPELRESMMLVAWDGWPNACNSATQTIDTIESQMGATPLANIDGERFFNYTDVRPSIVGTGSDRKIVWPRSRFSYRQSPKALERDMVIFSGNEPHRNWHAYCDAFAQMASNCDTQVLITVGTFLYRIPHTIKPPVMVCGTDDVGQYFPSLSLPQSEYEGPVAISSVISERFSSSSIACISIWGAAPNYIDTNFNPSLILAILEQLQPFIPYPIDTTKLLESEQAFKQETQQKVDSIVELKDYVEALEDNYSANAGDSVVNDVERFLNERHQGEGNAK